MKGEEGLDDKTFNQRLEEFGFMSMEEWNKRNKGNYSTDQRITRSQKRRPYGYPKVVRTEIDDTNIQYTLGPSAFA